MSRGFAGTCTSNSGPSNPTMPLVRAPVTRVLEWLCHFDTSRKEHVSDETAQTPSLSQRSRQLGARLRVPPAVPCRYCQLCRDPRCSLATECVSMSLTRLLRRHRSARGFPATQSKKPPCNSARWKELKRTVKSPPLCLRRECRLHSQRLWPGAQWTVAVQGDPAIAPMAP